MAGKQYSFNTFLVDESNREAAEICQAVAELQPISPQPIVILGDEGGGKTHLLYSIVNRVRAGFAKVGLAYVTAYDFPDQVRALVDDPSPVQRASKAILLVDQLEQFGDLVEEIEAVVRIFLDNNHTVVMGSSIHPGRLQNITEGLKGVVCRGKIIDIKPHSTQTRIELIRREAREEIEAERTAQQQENEELRRSLDEANKHVSAMEFGAAELGAQIDIERKAREEIERKLQLANEQSSGLLDEMARTREELRQARDMLSQAVAQPQAATQEIAALREQVESLRIVADAARESERSRAGLAGQIDVAQAEILRLQEQTASSESRNAAQADEISRLQRELQAATAENTRLREETNAFLHRTESLVARIESDRGQISQLQQEQRSQVTELLETIEQRARARAQTAQAYEQLQQIRTELQEAVAARDAIAAERDSAILQRDAIAAERDAAAAERDRVASQRDDVAAERDALRASLEEAQREIAGMQALSERSQRELDGLRADLERVHADQRDLRAALEHARAENEASSADASDARAGREALRADFDRVSRDLALLQSDMDGLRKEAAAQVASVQAQAGELEGRLARLQSAADKTREIVQTVSVGLRTLGEELRDASATTLRLAEQLSGTTETPTGIA